MARCSTCHRRLKAGRACPVHAGVVAEVAPVAAEPFDWPPQGEPSGQGVADPRFARTGDRSVALGSERVGGLLGAGGFAAVWELGTECVIKVAHASHELSRARIAREAEAMRAVTRGVQQMVAVPRVHSSGVLADGRAYIVMDRVTGTTISDLVAEGSLRAPEGIALGLSILESLGRIHAAGFVHRDLKPDNLVRTPDLHVVILDLGLARKVPTDPDDPTRAGVQVGSLEYMPPEQIADSANVDERTDLYAFGCVLYELLAGRPPFVGDAAALERAHAALRPPRLGATVTIPAAVDLLVGDLLAKDRARRPESVAATRERLIVSRDERTPPKMSHSVSVIREGKQPVVLLWVELPRVDRALLSMLTGRRLVLASQRGRRVLAGVLGGEHSDPAAVAIAAARDLATAGARVALHLEALRVTASGGTTKLHGDPVEKPETWLPAGTLGAAAGTPAWGGVVMTAALASVTQAPTRAAESVGPGFRLLGEGEEMIELVGREALLTDLAADAAAALQTSGPAIALLVGDPGVGKTAFASELARRIAELGNVRLHLGTVPAPGTGKSGASALTELIGIPQGPIVRGIGDALRVMARVRPTAVILDDLHYAEADLLDALEYATLGGESLPLWVLGVTAPRLEQRRPGFGARAERRRRDTLPPLDEDAAVALSAALLRPAEYPPLRALRRLAEMTHGNPLHLQMLVREIHQRGAVRERARGSHFLDTSALDELSPAALGPWLAARELAGLSPELVALARLCAVLGGDVHRDELVAIVDAVERTGGATTTVDVEIGLRELVAHGILIAGETGYIFRQALVEEGIYATTNEDERLALHRAALAYWRGGEQTPATAERVARHAESIGDAHTAAAAYATLGVHAFAQQHLLDADQAWSRALRHLQGYDAERARALLGRARARYRLQRMNEALVDLEEATAIAAQLGDMPFEIELLIEQGTVLDFIEGIAGDFARSKQVAERARERLGDEAARHPELALDIELADARTLFRAQRYAEGVPLLREVREKARALGRHESAAIAALMLGPALSDQRELDEAERVFEQMIADCVARGDRWHLAAAYGNRAWLWSAKGEIDRTEDDLRHVIQLAREAGQAHYERVATHNLAETLLWRDQLDDALRLARRGLSLQSHGEGTTRPDRMLLARVLAARGDRVELQALLATFDAEADLADDDRITLAVLRALAADDRGALAQVMEGIEPLFAQLRLELAVLAARSSALPEGLRPALIELARQDPLWSGRIGEL